MRDVKGHKFFSTMHMDAKDYYIWLYECRSCKQVISIKNYRKGKKPEEVSPYEDCPNQEVEQ